MFVVQSVAVSSVALSEGGWWKCSAVRKKGSPHKWILQWLSYWHTTGAHISALLNGGHDDDDNDSNDENNNDAARPKTSRKVLSKTFPDKWKKTCLPSQIKVVTDATSFVSEKWTVPVFATCGKPEVKLNEHHRKCPCTCTMCPSFSVKLVHNLSEIYWNVTLV